MNSWKKKMHLRLKTIDEKNLQVNDIEDNVKWFKISAEI